ncbi:MAG: NAD(P)/FAD-dependent oxidoreductase [bacterium]
MGNIAVIGAGPAGLAAAKMAAQQGMKVTLWEKGIIGAGIRCAEGYFDFLGLLAPPGAGIKYKVQGICFHANKEYYLAGEHLRIWMIDRSVWQQYMAREAVNNGVELREKVRISPQDLISLQKEYDWVIDASGVPPVSARVYGFSDFYLPHSLVTAQYTVEGDFTYLQDQIKIGIDPGYFGYYWVFPKGENVANVGIALLPATSATRDTKALWPLVDKILVKENLVGAKVLKRCGGLCPAKVLPRLVWDNLILVGDAAGLCSPLHGGGIDRALVSGEQAITAICTGNVNAYREKLQDIFGKCFRLETRLVDIWSRSSFAEMERLIAGISAFSHGNRINALLPLSRGLLQRAYYFLDFWQALQGKHSLQ